MIKDSEITVAKLRNAENELKKLRNENRFLKRLTGNLIRKYLNSIIAAGVIMGPDPRCEDYPCHFEGQDCTWCVCPFYPCGDFRTNGKQIESDKDGKLVWDCSNCTWIHSPKVAKAVLDEIIKFTNSGKHELGKISKGKLLQLRLRLIEILNGPQA